MIAWRTVCEMTCNVSSGTLTRTHSLTQLIVGVVEGKSLAKTHGSKYMEVSAILNHKVDDLLVSALKQIRLCNGGGKGRPHRRAATDHATAPQAAAGDDGRSTDNDNCSTTTTTTTTCTRSPGLLSRLIRAASPRRT